MRVGGIIFDKDGTLMSFDAFWVSLSVKALEDVLGRLGMEPGLVDEILEAFGVHDGVTDINGVLCKGTYAEMGEIVYEILSAHGCDADREHPHLTALFRPAAPAQKGIFPAVRRYARAVVVPRPVAVGDHPGQADGAEIADPQPVIAPHPGILYRSVQQFLAVPRKAGQKFSAAHFNVKDINACINLEKQALTLHNRFTGHSTDVSQSKNCCTV